VSESLCRAITGESALQRALHTDDEINNSSFQRVMAMTTIALKHELAGDLADRMVLIEPQVIEDRRTEEDIRTAQDTALPAALGAILDLVAGTLKHLPGIRLTELPRMADFARVLAALDTHTGWATLPTYLNRVNELGETLLEGNQLAQALRALAKEHPATPWTGNATEVLAELQRVCHTHRMHSSDITTAASQIGKDLRQIAPTLRKVGVDVRELKRTRNSRGYTVGPLAREKPPAAQEPEDPSLFPEEK
jgi:hypothetical protein